MSIVNSITNLVDLNTTKYDKKLKKMKGDTKSATKDIGKSFAGIGTAWKAALAAVATGALTGAITNELKATETAVASFITATGGVKEAREQFEMLQQAARDTIQPFDALKAVALDLRKNGIQATADQLKTFSQIAYGTGQSLETVGKAFTATMQGRYKALQQLGVTAKDNGATLLVTYKGITSEIEKNSDALGAYFEKLGKENEGVLEYLQGGVTGALNQLENAWGDFYRALAESGLGKLITDAVRTAADALDSLTAWINDNRPYFESFFNQVREGFNAIADTVKQSVGAALSYISDFFDDSAQESKNGLNNLGFFLSQFFNFARKGFMEYVAKPAAIAWEAIKGSFSSASEYLATLAYTGSFEAAADAYSDGIQDMADNMAEAGRLWDKAIDLQVQDIDSNRKKLESELSKAPEVKPVTFDPISFKPAGGAGGKSAGAKKTEVDSWASYIDKIRQMQRDAYSDLAKLRADYNDRINELLEAYKNSHVATEEDLAEARAVIDADYRTKYEALAKEAQEFLRGIRKDELEDLEAEYTEKLEKLQEYHDEALISEQEFLDARDKLRKDFEKAQSSARSRKNEFFTDDDLENMQQFTDGMNSLSDAFGNLKTNMSESSATYRTLFAIEKSFAIASATANAIVAWTKALSTSATWYESLANYASAVALTTGIISQISSLTMHDKGGIIPAGGVGIVGEYGPELVSGPANVTSRKRTADLARQAVNGGEVTVNLYENAEKAGQVEQTQAEDGERIINIFVSNIRRGGQIARTLESTYQVKRFGA